MHLSAQKIIDYCDAILSNSEFNVEDIMETDSGDAMLAPEETGYIVVECKRAINQNKNRVCVPKTWITCNIPPGKKVAFGVKNKEPADKSWTNYIGVIQFESESYEDAVGSLQTICGENSVQIEDHSNQKSHEDPVDLETICGGNSEQIEDHSNQKSHEDAVGYQTIFGENSKQIEEKSNTIEPVTEPKTPLKLRIVIPKLNQKTEKKKKSEKKHHKKHLKEHSKDKVRKSKHRYMEQLPLTDSIYKRSSPNSVDTRTGTESRMSCQSNCQSSESSPKSLESEISNSVYSPPETHLKNNNNNSHSSKRILLESLDAEKENNDSMLSEDRQLVENMYINIIRHVQYMKTTALEMKKSHLIAMQHREILNKIAAKYKIPLPPVTDPVERENERNGELLGEERVQDDEIETQGDDVMENEAQVTEENDNTSEENLLEERKNPEKVLESESDNQIYTDDESTEDYLPSSPEVVKYRGKAISKANDITHLKHPRQVKGLIQIGRNSRIYISAKGLVKAKNTCTDVKQFARQLFREAFTHKALRTCSMTGFTRPALHYEARTTLKNYALKYGQEVGWDSIEPKELEKNLSRFLANSRRNILGRRKT